MRDDGEGVMGMKEKRMCGFNKYPESQITPNCVQEAWSGHGVQDVGCGIGINGGKGQGAFSDSWSDGISKDESTLFSLKQASGAACLDITSLRA